MRNCWLRVVCWVSLALALPFCATAVAAQRLTVWLVPMELPAVDADGPRDFLERQIDDFNRAYGTDSAVTVLNTTRAPLRDQLLVRTVEYAGPVWAMIKGQRETLAALQRFAREQRQSLNVRFLSWSQLLGEVEQATRRPRADDTPDVVQLGSTWVANLGAQGLLLAQDETDGASRLTWRNVPQNPRASLPHTTDLRLLFYWRRPRGASSQSQPLVLPTNSWPALVDKLAAHVSANDAPPLVFPNGLTYNLLHEYTALVRAGGGAFLNHGQVDLTSQEALAMPLYLAQNATCADAQGRRRRLLAFPEMSRQEATRLFQEGYFTGIVESAAFVAQWQHDFARQARTGDDGAADFWIHAGFGVPPSAFRGGSDLALLRGTPNPTQASALARFLTTDEEYTRVLAALGYLPAQRRDYGLDVLADALQGAGTPQPEAAAFADLVRQALKQTPEYPPPEPAWATHVEAPETLEALQSIWRRIGEGDPERVRAAAAKAETGINLRLSWRVRWWAWVVERGPYFIPLLLALAALLGGLWRRAVVQHRGKLLALRLYRTVIHSRLHENGARITEFADCPATELPVKLRDYGELIAHTFNRYLGESVDAITDEMERHTQPLALPEVLARAWHGAQTEYSVAWAEPPPPVKLDCAPDLAQWQVVRYPRLLAVALAEWFYNCLKSPLPPETSEPPVIAVRVQSESKRMELHICSPATLKPEQAAVLAQPPTPIHHSSGQGLPLIRDLLWYGLGTRAVCYSENGTRLVIPLPLRRMR